MAPTSPPPPTSALCYPVLMNPFACVKLLAACFLCVFLFPVLEIFHIFYLPYCGPNRINHFFCDTSPVLQLPYINSSCHASAIFLSGVIVSLSLTLISYRMHNYLLWCAQWLCCHHLPEPKSIYLPEYDKLLVMSYMVFTLLLNPMMHSLRNKNVRLAIQKTMVRML